MINATEDMVFRRGPSPFPVHMGLVMAEYARLQQSGDVRAADMALMLDGIRKYQVHPFRREAGTWPVIWQEGEVRIFHVAADSAVATPLLLVPSLINKSSILDLLPEKSFARWIAAQGIDCFVLDWGKPTDDEGQHSIDDLIGRRLCPAIEAVAGHCGTPIHALGYCMGGTILAAASLFCQADLRSIICLASPWDFDAGDRKLSQHVQAGTAAARQVIGSTGRLPMDWIQSVFAAVNADRAMKKFCEFAALDNGSDAAKLFVAVEDWLNDGVDLPGTLAENFIVDWYGQNVTGNGAWFVAGEKADLSKLNIPAFIVASTNDRLVPFESSEAMANIIPGARLLKPQSGHIGMMTGGKAKDQVWKPVADWVRGN